MRKLTSYPMKKLCYDLKLEVVKEMSRNETIELVKVNKGFRSILLRSPWLVFGNHVPWIISWGDTFDIEDDSGYPLEIDANLHRSLTKRIHACYGLDIDLGFEQFSDARAMLLNQLHFVEYLTFERSRINTKEANFLKFLENFHSVIERSAIIDVHIDLLIENQVIKKLFENFIANQMNDCEEVEFQCDSVVAFHFYNDALAKSSIKCLIRLTCRNYFEDIVQLIVKKLIPRKNLKATFYLETGYSQEKNARIIEFLSQIPGIKRFDGENQQEIVKMLGVVLKKYLETSLYFTKIIFFRRNVDSSCGYVYVLASSVKLHNCAQFFTSYVQPPPEMMNFES